MTSISLVSNDSENPFQGKRGLRNGPSSASKRPALTSIANLATLHNDQSKQTSLYDHLPVVNPVVNPTVSSMPSSALPTFNLISDLYANPNTSLSNAMHYSSFEDSAFSLSTSIVSLTSPDDLCSPMLISSPDTCPPEFTITNEWSDEYASDVHANWKCRERALSPPVGFVRLQPDINANMRSILVDWLIEVVEEFQLQPQTLHLAVCYTDRYLARVSMPRSKLQLLGTTSLYLAAKYEEIHPPSIGEFAYITDDTYTKKQIVKLEADILKVLEFQLVQPTIHTFLMYYNEISKTEDAITNKRIECMAKYLSELSLLDVEPFCKYVPSVTASAAVCLARHSMAIDPWPFSLQMATGYRLGEINQCLQDLHRSHALASCHQQQAARQKYLAPKYMEIAMLSSPETLPC